MTRRTVSHLGYFLCLGAGFMVLEIGLMEITAILFDTPGEAIAIIIASIILFMGLGSLYSFRNLAGRLSLRIVAASVSIYAVILYLALGPVIHAMLAWPLAQKAAAVIAIVAPGAFLMGHLFPRGLAVAASDDARFVPWAWGINGATSTVAPGIVPFLAMAWGFNTLFLLGAGLYAALLLFPTSRGKSATA
jgi:hypothetical protein